MKNTKIAINGFGRIGRLALRLISDMDNMEVVAINDPFIDVDYAAYMLKYDTIHSKFNGEITTCGNKLVVNGKEIDFYNEKEIENLNWAKTGVDIVLEASGKFTKAEEARKHIASGAKKSCYHSSRQRMSYVYCWRK